MRAAERRDFTRPGKTAGSPVIATAAMLMLESASCTFLER